MTRSHVGAPSINCAIVALRFFFSVTLERPDLVRHAILSKSRRATKLSKRRPALVARPRRAVSVEAAQAVAGAKTVLRARVWSPLDLGTRNNNVRAGDGGLASCAWKRRCGSSGAGCGIGSDCGRPSVLLDRARTTYRLGRHRLGSIGAILVGGLSVRRGSPTANCLSASMAISVRITSATTRRLERRNIVIAHRCTKLFAGREHSGRHRRSVEGLTILVGIV